MVCEHLRALEAELIGLGIRETARGQVWTENCREWVYFDCFLDLEAIRRRMDFDPCVVDHVYRGTHEGSEAGFKCTVHHDAVMGVHEDHARDRPRIV